MQHILTLNGGSSSIKFALFEIGDPLKRLLAGKLERIGLPDAAMEVTDLVTGQSERRAVAAPDHVSCVQPLARFLEQRVTFEAIAAAGHRIVHGGPRYHEPESISPEVLAYLEQISPYDPEHLPTEIAIIRALAQDYPNLMQVACFDTAFHREMPRVATILPIPRRYLAQGVQRYGFHGLSYSFLMDELKRVAGETAAHGRIILAHLGNGASMAAVRAGISIDTTMAFTPTAGLVMSARAGDLDPGLTAYLARAEKMTPERFYQMANFESGLLGVSETSSDMRDLLQRSADDPRAAEAVALFCYTAKKFIGAYAAALGGLDTLVFAGGIGEKAAVIRAEICEGLQFLGLELERARNDASAPVISADTSHVTVRVIKTDEELQIAQSVRRLLP
jgi:acetate kinase